MAAIDKLYVKEYLDYDELVKWSLVYYPKLLLFMCLSLRYQDFGEHEVPIMNTPFSVDRKLKWICPVPCVREYLHNQCGVNPKWEWLYKIFWRGKKYF
jgi:hypothetical protein